MSNQNTYSLGIDIGSTTVKIAMTEEDVLTFLSNPENLKQFKGDIKIDKVVL